MGWKGGRGRLERYRFLAPLKGLFTTRKEGSRWPRWRETWRAAHAYLDGLLAPGRRKNMEAIARRVGMDEDRVERFVRESPWEYEALQDYLVAHVPEGIRSPGAALVVDDVGIIKQGRHSVGVYRQYSGALGKVGNCQVAVDMTYAVPGGRRNADQVTWPLGMELYLPRPWVEEPEYEDLRGEVGLPRNVGFRTKPEIALSMIDAARAHRIEHAVVVADAGYGDNMEFRTALRRRREAYVLGVDPSRVRVVGADVPVEIPPVGRRGGRPWTAPAYPEGVRAESPGQNARWVEDWGRVEWAEGTRGPLAGLFYRTRVRVTEGAARRRHATGEVAWLLLERRANELKAYLCWGLDHATLEELVGYAHLRWTIEQYHREAKQLLGLDRFEGRTWKGWHHHVAMVLLAYAFLAHLRAGQGGRDPLPTLPQVARAVVLEVATQDLLKHHRLTRRRAKSMATSMVRRLTDW